MRHVPLAEFHDKLAETIAAAQAGEDIVITDDGRETVRLTPVRVDDIERRRQSFARLAVMREQMRAEGRTVTRDEVRQWIDEGRP